MGKKIFISTGEVSGDLHGSYLIQALLALDPTLEITALGGPRMAQAGAQLIADTGAISSIGYVEALPYILPTLKVQRIAKKFLRQNPPDLVVYIDYIGPNVQIGKFIRKLNPAIPGVFYIGPQEWVWNAGTANTSDIVGFTDLILAIFPEEANYYARNGAKRVLWIGNPLVDIVQTTKSREVIRQEMAVPATDPVVVLMPGSRAQEIRQLMPAIFEGARLIQETLPAVHFWVPLSSERFREAVQQDADAKGLKIKITQGNNYDVLAASDLVISKSGTVNLETAILDIPQLVLYRLSEATAFIARKILKVNIPFISPVNLLEMRTIVPEYVQEDSNPENIAREGLDLLTNQPRRRQMRIDYAHMLKKLGTAGVVQRGAQEILNLIK
ncbi:MAG: lipid-A-disaccharide synthase [Gloeobacterales cyanobacterium]